MKSQSISTMRERNEVLCSALQRERERERETHTHTHSVTPELLPCGGEMATLHLFAIFSALTTTLLLCIPTSSCSCSNTGLYRRSSNLLFIIIISTNLSNCFKLFATECINHQYNDLQTCWPECCQVEEELVKFFLWYRVTYMVPQETRSTRVLT